MAHSPEEARRGVIGAHYETTFKGDQSKLGAAEVAAAGEKSMSLRETLSIYRSGVFWSIALSTALIMEGYDTAITGSFFGQAAFLERFGQVSDTGVRYIPANWQGALSNGASVGQVIGLSINGYCQARFGSKRTYMCGMVAMAAAIFVPVFSTSLGMLFAGALLCGIPWGLFQTLTTSYASEICPIRLRGYLTSYVNCCWGIGLTLGAGVVRASLAIEGNWSWRMPYMVQWVWPVPLFIAALLAPESPWWLVRKGRIDDAAATIRRLGRRDYMTEDRVDAQLSLMQHTIELEAAESAQRGSWKDMFRGTNARRTEITCMVWSAQYLCGQPLTGYAAQFLERAGMSADGAFDLGIANNVMIFAGTVISWVAFYRFGRRILYLAGTAIMGLLFLIMGVLGCLPDSSNVSVGIGALMVIITLIFGFTLAPVCYTIVAEVPSTTVRTQTVVLARACYVIAGIVLNQLFPRFITPPPDGWAIGGKAGFVFVGVNAVLLVYFFFRLPETIGRTFGEIDTLFANRVPARLFSKTEVDEFEADRDVVPKIEEKQSADVVHIEETKSS